MAKQPGMPRSMGLAGAVSVGVGAIVGGGILALAGVAFAATGPSAVVAFALNGVIALLTALSFAELATQFPESGGTYAYARKVLSIEAAFGVGWVVWFASIVAGVLYAFGFGAFAWIAIDDICRSAKLALPAWLSARLAIAGLAIAATVVCAALLARTASGASHWPNIGKVVVFAVLVVAGLGTLAGTPAQTVHDQLRPFFSRGALGLVQAMGFTFIALQGFDLIAAVSGEIREPRRTIPKAMFFSLGIALAIYLPLLFVVATVGVDPGRSVTEVSAEQPEAIIAIAGRRFLGSFGYWLVITAAILSMVSALQANLLAASRIARVMARERTLPDWMDRLHPQRGTPTTAILATTVIVAVVLVVVPDVAALGASASLVFLVTFALAHGIAIIARRRGGATQPSFRTPWFPLVPTVGMLACAALAVFQGIHVPQAGVVAVMWLALGGILFVGLFARRARTMDAYGQALDAELVRLRGHSPLVLVPITNPSNAEAMVGLATALAPRSIGRVLVLSIVPSKEPWQDATVPQAVIDSQLVVRQALGASFSRSLAPEVLTTVADEPWREIARVARTHQCESLLLGLSDFAKSDIERRMEQLVGSIDCDVVVLRAPAGWLPRDVRRILVPIGGQGAHEELRARLLASMQRLGQREVTMLRILSERASDRAFSRAERALARIARDEAPANTSIEVLRSNDPAAVLCARAAQCDLVILGVRRPSRRGRAFGDIALRIARETSCGLVMISRRG